MISSEVFTKLPSMLEPLLTQQDTLPGPELGMQVHCLSCLWSGKTQLTIKPILLSQPMNCEIWRKYHNYLPLPFPINSLLRCFFLWSSWCPDITRLNHLLLTLIFEKKMRTTEWRLHLKETKNKLPVECTQPVIFELQDPFPLFFQWNALYFHTETNTLASLRVLKLALIILYIKLYIAPKI